MRHGSPFEAYYYIASLHAARAHDTATQPEMRAGSCPVAVSFYKLVAERGCWKEDLLAEAEVLWQAGEEKRRAKTGLLGTGTDGESTREHGEAMLRWFIAAERGYEIAQNNIAWVLDQGEFGYLSVSGSFGFSHHLWSQTRAVCAIHVFPVHRRMILPA